jgi:WD40 repeat protein
MKYLLLIIALSLSAFSQSLTLFDIDTTDFPIMRAKFYAFDEDGNQVRPDASELRITEDGVEREILSVYCPPEKPPITVSVAMSIDVSGSMAGSKFGEVPVELGKTTARELYNLIAMPPSEFALQTCNDKALIIEDFTTNRNRILTAIEPINANGDNDFVEHLLNNITGLINIAKNGKNKKVAVIYTDAWWYALTENELQECINLCKQQNIEFYSVIYSRPEAEPNGIKSSLQKICNETGGILYDGITSEEAAKGIALNLQKLTQGAEPCEIEWESGVVCDYGRTSASLYWKSYESKGTYQPPTNVVASIKAEPRFLYFGGIEPGTTDDAIITLKATNSDYTILNIVPNLGITNFNFVDLDFPFKIEANTSKDITLRFSPSDSSMQYESFEIITEKCSGNLSIFGGFLGQQFRTKTLKLSHPNGREKFVVGSDTLITWEGISPTDKVSLEYSFDNGITWQNITNEAIGLKFNWQNIPKPISNKCLFKIKQKLQSNNNDTVLTLNNMGSLNHISWSPDGKRIATASDDDTAKIWEVKNGKLLYNLVGHNYRVNYVDWSPDGNKVATSSIDFTAKIWDVNTGQLLHNLGHLGYVNNVSWSPDGSKVATAGFDETAKIWDVNTGQLLHNLRVETFKVNHVSWSPDGSKVAIAINENLVNDVTAKIWNAQTGQLFINLTGHEDNVNHISWSPDGSRVATSSNDKTARIWNAQTGQLLHTLGHLRDVNNVSWSPDGSRVATSSNDGTAKIWDVNNGQLLNTLILSKGAVINTSWSPDGSRVATASSDKTGKIWDANTGELLNTLIGHTSAISHISWSPDLRRVATASADGTGKIWDLEVALLQEDQSDNVFSIVMPEAQSLDIDMLKEEVGKYKVSLITDFVKNVGSWKFDVDSIYFRGADSDAFSLLSGFPVYTVEPNSSQFAEIRFTPKRVGIHNAEVVIITQADTLVQNITGEGVQQSLEVINNFIDFGAIDIGLNKDTLRAVTIKNVSTLPMTITDTKHGYPNDIDFTTLANGGNFILDPGQEWEMDLRFEPSVVGRTSGILEFHYDGVGSPAIVQLFGEGIGTEIYSEITVDQYTQQAGEEFIIDLQMTESENMDSLGAPRDFEAELSYNGSIVYFEEGICDNGFDCKLNIAGTWDGVSENIYSIPAVATLGNTEFTDIEITDFEWKDSQLETDIDLLNGSLTIDGICEDEAVRLYHVGDVPFSIATRPQPFSNELKVQIGMRETLTIDILLLDLNGIEIKKFVTSETLNQGKYDFNFDTSDLNAGVYYIRLISDKGELLNKIIKE